LFMRWLMTLSVMMLAMYIWQKNSRHWWWKALESMIW
jgi:hypothetical protein